MDMATGMGTTVKQVKKLKIKLRIDGSFGVYDQGECLYETLGYLDAIEYCINYKRESPQEIKSV